MTDYRTAMPRCLMKRESRSSSLQQWNSTYSAYPENSGYQLVSGLAVSCRLHSPAVPAAPGIAETFKSGLGHGNGILELDITALGVRQSRLDRHDHTGFERPVDVIGGIGNRAFTGQARRLMGNKTHAVGGEGDDLAVRRLAQRRRGRRIDLAADRAGPDRPASRLLNGVDVAQEILKLGVRLTEKAHSAEIADITFVVAARIERQNLALFPALIGRRAVEARSGSDKAIFEGEAALLFLALQRLRQFLLGDARTMPGNHRHHRIDDTLGAFPQQRQFGRRLAGAETLQDPQGFYDLAIGNALA